MVMFGDLGKMLKLDTPGGRKGSFDTLQKRIIDDPLETAQRQANIIAEGTIKRELAEQEKYRDDLRQHLDEVKVIAGQVGRGGAQYLINRYGIVGAKEKGEQLQKLSEVTGQEVSDLLGIDPTDERLASLEQLAQSVTAIPKIYDIKPAKAKGTAGFFGFDVGERAKKEADIFRKGMGLDDEYAVPDIDDIEADFDPFVLGTQTGLEDEAARNLRRGLLLQEEGKADEAKKFYARGRQLLNLSALGDSKSLTTAQTRLFQKDFLSAVSLANNLSGEYDANGYYTPRADNLEDQRKAQLIASQAMKLFNDALKAGVDKAEALDTIIIGLTQNRAVRLVDNELGGKDIVLTPEEGDGALSFYDEFNKMKGAKKPEQEKQNQDATVVSANIDDETRLKVIEEKIEQAINSNKEPNYIFALQEEARTVKQRLGIQ
jgi:hypothetical protein